MIYKNSVFSHLKNGVALVLLLSASLSLTGCFLNRQAQYANKPVVTVGEVGLSTKELARELTKALKNYDFVTAKDPSVIKQAKEAIIKEFIVTTLVATWANKSKIEVSEKELDDEIAKIRKDYPDDLAFREELNESGISFPDWKRNLKFTLLQRKVFAKINEGQDEPSEEEIKQYYQNNKPEFQIPDRVKIKQIVLDKKDNAELIQAEIKKGTDFDDLVKKYSIAPSAKSEDISEWIEKGSLPIFDKAYASPVGKVSNVEQSPFGFHIYKVIDRQQNATIQFEQARTRIRQKLMSNREQARFTSWLDQQLRQTTIFRDDALVAAITVETRRSED